MEHKAFAFDYDRFQRELRPLIEAALVTNDCKALIAFIDENIDSLTDPYEGERLPENWQDMLEIRDVHQLGDFALTKYYNSREDLGLGAYWEKFQRMTVGTSSVLGSIVGVIANPFDPGKMGTYFQSPQQVVENLRLLKKCPFKDDLGDVITMLDIASERRMGLYVTF